MTLSFTEWTESAGGLIENLPLGEVVDPGAGEKVWYFLSSGGFFMAFIALCSLIALSVVFHRALALRKANVVPDALEAELLDLERRIADEDTGRLGQMLSGNNSSLARITRVALNAEHTSRDTAATAAEASAREEVVKLHSGIAVLEVVITIAPLLGLLGTVSGLVSVFGTLGGSGAELTDPAQVARGIAEALNTTIAGLVVAVPAVVAHSYFSKKIERFAVRMEVLVEMALGVFYRPTAPPPAEVAEAAPAEPAPAGNALPPAPPMPAGDSQPVQS